MTKVMIDRHELEELLRSSWLLEELKANGVDNWKGYEEVIQDYQQLSPIYFSKALDEYEEITDES